ncbi:MAG: hypothetical protein LWY06_20785 [Firmicutes bacterium]|nr:hypothetical protein [Bacillota bacterium]
MDALINSANLEMALRPATASLPAETFPTFEAVITNKSTKPVTICTYLAKHRLFSNMMAGDYEIMVFSPTPQLPLKDSDFVTIQPDAEFKIELNIYKEPAYAFVYAGHLPPVVTKEMAIKGFPAGSYDFRVHIGSHVLMFNAPEGTSDHNRKRVHILSEVPPQGVSIDKTKVWDGELKASAKVTFA